MIHFISTIFALISISRSFCAPVAPTSATKYTMDSFVNGSVSSSNLPFFKELNGRITQESLLLLANTFLIKKMALALQNVHQQGVLVVDGRPSVYELDTKTGNVSLKMSEYSMNMSRAYSADETEKIAVPASHIDKYTSPEVRCHFPLLMLTAASDVYALGASMYALYEGHEPRFPLGIHFDYCSFANTGLMWLTSKTKLSFSDKTPETLRGLLNSMMAFTPVERPPLEVVVSYVSSFYNVLLDQSKKMVNMGLV